MFPDVRLPETYGERDDRFAGGLALVGLARPERFELPTLRFEA
jgi:hypothetical protein